MRGEYGRWHHGEQPPADDAADWLAGRLPDEWFEGAPDVTVDREEIVVVGTLPAPEAAADASAESRSATESGRIARFREETREQRIGIAREAEARYGRKVAWGAQAGETRQIFTSAAVPVMTRLRQADRQVLDTLVDAGVARSRADALAWCVKLVGQHAESWLGELREAMTSVDEVRARGPEL
jgi:hypothetical protein